MGTTAEAPSNTPAHTHQQKSDCDEHRRVVATAATKRKNPEHGNDTQG